MEEHLGSRFSQPVRCKVSLEQHRFAHARVGEQGGVERRPLGQLGPAPLGAQLEDAAQRVLGGRRVRRKDPDGGEEALAQKVAAAIAVVVRGGRSLS